MKLIQLTDIHLTTPGQTIGGRDPNQNFDRALAHALEFHSDAEAFVITGDLSDWGERADYERLRARIAELPMPVHLCIGNHDDRELFLTVFPELRGEGGFVQRVEPLSQGHAIMLDTWGPETHAGHFCEARAAWLDKTLDELPGPVWIFQHHNPVPLGIPVIDEIGLLDAERLADVLRRHPGKVAHLFHGHCHLPLSGSIAGVPFSAPRGTNHAGWPDYSGLDKLSASDLPEAYAVIQSGPLGVMVAMVEYGYAGAVRSEGSPNYADWNRAEMVR